MFRSKDGYTINCPECVGCYEINGIQDNLPVWKHSSGSDLTIFYSFSNKTWVIGKGNYKNKVCYF